MEIYLHNTLTKQKELFKPAKPGHVSMYHCGPTVYNNAHIGNLRAYIAADVLRRTFELNDYTVSQIMNITDIGHLQHDEIDAGDDKMTLALRREGKELTRENMKELALKYFDAFRADEEKVNILPANLYPFASEHIAEDIDFIEKLIAKGNAYVAEDGVYFDTASLPDYGKLGGLATDASTTESRIGDEEIAKSRKKSPRDFAVWKFNEELGYETSFGKGFPGWHIECSVMSMKYLGGVDEMDEKTAGNGDHSAHSHDGHAHHIDWAKFETFDIHTGGIDHIPVHHNNEIAQTEAISGKPLARYWLHNAHLIIEGGKKMAKSGESFITLETLENKGISPLGFRYWVLGGGYRTSLQFSYEALENAERAYRSLVEKVAHIRLQAGIESLSWKSFSDLDSYLEETSSQLDAETADRIEKLKSLINDDLNTPKVLAFLNESVLNNANEKNALNSFHKMHLIKTADIVLGLDLLEASKQLANAQIANSIVPPEIKQLAEKRKEARANKSWDESDDLREQINTLGYDIKDVDDGYIVSKKLV